MFCYKENKKLLEIIHANALLIDMSNDYYAHVTVIPLTNHGNKVMDGNSCFDGVSRVKSTFMRITIINSKFFIMLYFNRLQQ